MKSISFRGTGLTPGNPNRDMRVLLYYWPISGLSANPISGKVEVVLITDKLYDYDQDGYSLILFNGGNQTYPQSVPDWHEKNENVAYAHTVASDTKTNFYLNNSNFSSYDFYVNTPVTISMEKNGEAENKKISFTIPKEYQNKDLWNGNNIFLGFAAKTNDDYGIYWAHTFYAELTLNTAAGTVKYYINNEWKDCEVLYYDGSNWKQCEVNYYDNGWKPIG